MSLLARQQAAGPLPLGVIPPPPGVNANIVNPEWNGQILDVVGILFLVLSTLFVVLRLYTRIRIVKNVGLDDYLIVVAVLVNIPFVGLALAQNHLGGGNHLWDIPLSSFSPHFLLVGQSCLIHLASRL